MSFLPKIEKITRDATISHFLLMFGFRSFSLFYPLFLASKGFSLPQVGFAYLAIYLPIALFAPLAGYLNHKINPAILAALGALGYGLFSLGMILFLNQLTFYLLQILLGFSAALFFVSTKSLLISAQLEVPSRAFGWFYSAPYYAGAAAPAVGALIIWQFGFFGALVFSLLVELAASLFIFFRLSPQKIRLANPYFNFSLFQKSYKAAFQNLLEKKFIFYILVFFSVTILASFYQLYFVLFLKNDLAWPQNLILLQVSLFSFLFSPLSLFLIKRLEKLKTEKNIFQGGIVASIFSILFGVVGPFLNFFGILFVNLFRAAGEFVCDSSRSGLVSSKLSKNPEEASAIDTIFSPLSTAIGALIGGILISQLGYSFLFILGGGLVAVAILVAKKLEKS